MPSKQLKRSLVIAGVIVVIGFFAFAPLSNGYGTDFSSAEIISTGTTVESFGSQSSVYAAYYKVNCNTGSTLKVSLTYLHASSSFDLTLYDPNQSYLTDQDGAYTQISLSVQTVCKTSGYFYIRCWEDGSGVDTLTLNVQITAIPGFDPWLVLF